GPVRPSAGAAVALADPGLVALARSGDREAREELARRCRGPAYVLALQLLGNPDDALDVAQDSLLRLFDSFARFDPSRPLRPWLARIVRNRARDLQRRHRARPTLSLDGLLDGGFPEGRIEPRAGSRPPEAGPEERLARRQLQRRIWRALQELSPAHREILVLRDYQDLSYNEIAAVLEIPAGTVMSRLHAARRSLRRVLEEPGSASPGGAHHD
ncbi:MAG TPA: sigma-70 family RNA polymerase sigma factor, partial [Thermoanaerobaculia bacterium]